MPNVSISLRVIFLANTTNNNSQPVTLDLLEFIQALNCQASLYAQPQNLRCSCFWVLCMFLYRCSSCFPVLMKKISDSEEKWFSPGGCHGCSETSVLFYLLHELNSLPLLLLSQPLPPLPLLETFAEWVVVIKLDLGRRQEQKS